MPGRWRCVHPASLRWSLPRRAGWRLWVLNTAASTLILKIRLLSAFASPLAGACKKTPRVFSDGTCAPAGSSFCEHGRQRRQCRECGGSSFCEHGRKRAVCRECGGTAVCAHGRRRAHCRDCTNFVCQIEGCPRQGLPLSGAQSLLKHMRAMHSDNPRSVTKSKELEVRQAPRRADHL